MRSSSLLHLALGTIVTMISGLAGHVASLEPRTTGPRCERAPRTSRAHCPSSAKPSATWAPTSSDASGPGRVIVKYRDTRLASAITQELLTGGTMVAEATYRLAHTFGIPAPGTAGDLELGVAALERFVQAFPKHDLAAQAEFEIAQSYAHQGRLDQTVAGAAHS